MHASYNRGTIKDIEFSRTGSFADTVTGMYSDNADAISVGARGDAERKIITTLPGAGRVTSTRGVQLRYVCSRASA